MKILPNFEWRFDRVKPEHKWACCIWEYGREWHDSHNRCGRYQARAATVYSLCNDPGFPQTPWLCLPAGQKNALAARWRVAPGELEDCEPIVRALAEPPLARPTTADDWRIWLRKEGVVVFDLGWPPRDARAIRAIAESREIARQNGKYSRITNEDLKDGSETHHPTRAQLLAKFEAWLDSNPQWWRGRGTPGRSALISGKKHPIDGLRSLALLRLSRAIGRDKDVCSFLEQRFNNSGSLKGWFNLDYRPRAITARSRLRRQAHEWCKLICEPN